MRKGAWPRKDVGVAPYPPETSLRRMAMMIEDNSLMTKSAKALRVGGDERGAALAMALMLLALMSAIALTVLAVVHSETRMAGSDLKRTQTCYAAAAGLEKM